MLATYQTHSFGGTIPPPLSLCYPFSLARTIVEKMVEMSSIGNGKEMDKIERHVGVRVNIGQLILQQLQGLNTIADGPALIEIIKENFG